MSCMSKPGSRSGGEDAFEKLSDRAFGATRERMLGAQHRDLVLEFHDDVGADSLQGVQRLREHETDYDVLRTRQCKIDVAGNDLAFAIEEVRSDAVHGATTHGEELFEPQQIIAEAVAAGRLVK
jgi:IS5 family transposase